MLALKPHLVDKTVDVSPENKGHRKWLAAMEAGSEEGEGGEVGEEGEGEGQGGGGEEPQEGAEAGEGGGPLPEVPTRPGSSTGSGSESGSESGSGSEGGDGGGGGGGEGENEDRRGGGGSGKLSSLGSQQSFMRAESWEGMEKSAPPAGVPSLRKSNAHIPTAVIDHAPPVDSARADVMTLRERAVINSAEVQIQQRIDTAKFGCLSSGGTSPPKSHSHWNSGPFPR